MGIPLKDWTNIVRVAAGSGYTVGIKSDGTVVVVGRVPRRQEDIISSWTDIAQVAAGYYHTIGLKNDGTIIVVGYLYNTGKCYIGWTLIS